MATAIKIDLRRVRDAGQYEPKEGRYGDYWFSFYKDGYYSGLASYYGTYRLAKSRARESAKERGADRIELHAR